MHHDEVVFWVCEDAFWMCEHLHVIPQENSE